jgi:hypothetical protein
MKKLIKIDGELKTEGTTANLLNVAAAKLGIDLTEYIRLTLNDRAMSLLEALKTK